MNTYASLSVFLVVIGYLLTFVATPFSVPVLKRLGMIDHPNERSSHEQPVARGGGIIIVFAFAIIFGLLALIKPHDLQIFFLNLITIGLLVAAVGLYDDIHTISPGVRFALYTVIVAGAIYIFGVPYIPFLNYTIEPNWAVYLLQFLVLMWVLNLFNFMDGIDGIAATEAVFISLVGATILGIQSPGHELIVPLLCFTGICAGFLIWNWAPANVFMGDVASGFLGLIPALIGVVTSIDGSLSIWVWFILYGAFFIDASVAMLRHLARKEPIHIAHCNHAYQRAALVLQNRLNAKMSAQDAPSDDEYESRRKREKSRKIAHRTVCLVTTAINFAWLAPLALLASFHPNLAVLITAIALLPLIILAVKLGSGSTRAVGLDLFK